MGSKLLDLDVLSVGDDQPSRQRLAEIPVDDTEIPQGHLDIEIKVRSNNLPWKGQFSPQLIEVLLTKYSKEGDTVLDPFGGSGTVLSECINLGLRSFAAEINPAAYLLSRIYELAPICLVERQELVEEIDKTIGTNVNKAKSKDHFRSMIQYALFEMANSNKCYASSVLSSALAILVDYDAETHSSKDIPSTWEKLRRIVVSIPYSKNSIQAFHCDARKTPLCDSIVDLVVTSPPYINVFNYHQQYRGSAEALGWDLLSVAKSEIGSNRKHRTNRFLTVIQYCLDIAEVFVELARVCKPYAQVIFVVGRESRVRGIPFCNSGLVAQLAAISEHFEIEKRAERTFTNRFGERITEDILHFRRSSSNIHTGLPLADARTVASQALEAALKISPIEVFADLEAAIQQVITITPSPQFSPKDAN
ncbi:MAG: DNA methyltransferase [Edaphobacter sp.]